MKNKYFFIIGAQRSGSTLLYSILDKSPYICMAKPMRPEPKYFLQNKIDEKEYISKFFSHQNQENILVEKSTSYYELIEAGKRIKKFNSSSKLIVILRDPVNRCISNYKFSRQNKLESRSLEEVFILNKKVSQNFNNTSVNPFDYLKRGEYFKLLTPYIDLFGRKNIHIIQLESLIKEKETFHNIFNFLNVPKIDYPNDIGKINSTESNLSIPKEVLYMLRKYYFEKNQLLNNIMDIDLSLWHN